MKIRFYHWWIYKIYFKTWARIYADRPGMLRYQVEWMTRWLDEQEAK